MLQALLCHHPLSTDLPASPGGSALLHAIPLFTQIPPFLPPCPIRAAFPSPPTGTAPSLAGGGTAQRWGHPCVSHSTAGRAGRKGHGAGMAGVARRDGAQGTVPRDGGRAPRAERSGGRARRARRLPGRAARPPCALRAVFFQTPSPGGRESQRPFGPRVLSRQEVPACVQGIRGDTDLGACPGSPTAGLKLTGLNVGNGIQGKGGKGPAWATAGNHSQGSLAQPVAAGTSCSPQSPCCGRDPGSVSHPSLPGGQDLRGPSGWASRGGLGELACSGARGGSWQPGVKSR